MALADRDALTTNLPTPKARQARSRTLPWGARIGLAIVVFLVLIALFGPWLMTHDPNQSDFMAMNAKPSADYWLGTDDIGQDIYSRLLLGARLSLMLGASAALIAFFLGGVLALIAVAVGGVVEYLIFALVDMIRALPSVLFALAMIVALEPGTTSVIIALGISFSPNFARVTRATYAREQTMAYVAAAKTFGASALRIALRHIGPNILGALITLFMIILPRCIVLESVFSFLGLGVAPETPTWGRMTANATPFIEEAPHAVLIPVLALSFLTIGLGLLGDELRKRFDPTRRAMVL